jgi:integrase
MPRLVNKPPSYRLHKADGRAVVTINGRDIFLGKHGTPESRAEYDRVVGEYLANGRRLAGTERGAPADPSVNGVLLAFWRHAEAHYRHADGTPTGELDNYRDALGPLRRLFGTTPARDFGPLKLKAVRDAMVESGLARTTVNRRVGRVVRVFRFGVENELVPAAVYHALKAVPGLQKGRTAAREPEAVKPVPEADVDAVRPYVSRQVWTMVQLQKLTGMRPGEVVIMRTCDVDRTGPVWFYRPARHKTERHGRSRQVALGPRAQEVLKPWLRADPGAFLFSPREAMAEFRAGQRRDRTTRLYPPQRDRKPKRDPKRVLGDHYSTRTYNHAVRGGCRKAGVPHWHPNQIRHAVATKIRATHDLDAARAVLGHSDSKTSEIYAERDREQAARVMREIG